MAAHRRQQIDVMYVNNISRLPGCGSAMSTEIQHVFHLTFITGQGGSGTDRSVTDNQHINDSPLT